MILRQMSDQKLVPEYRKEAQILDQKLVTFSNAAQKVLILGINCHNLYLNEISLEDGKRSRTKFWVIRLERAVCI